MRSTLLLRSILLLIATRTATGQIAGSGSIQGTVTDPSGAVIADATVVAINAATGVQTSRVTNAAGFFVLSPLPAGEYSVSVKVPGFQSLRQDRIIVEALSTVSLNLEPKVGAASEQVTVEAEATTLRVDDVTLGGSMQNKYYETLPLAMGSGVPRDPTQFIGLMPGVSVLVTQASGPSYTSFNGGQAETNGLYLEGLSIAFPNQQGDTRNLALGVSVDAVDQFQVEVNGQKSMYQGQGFHNYILKSGTNGFHGAAFEYFRNTALDARGFFSPFVPVDHQNEFGGNFGGPVKRDKIFFFGNYSGYYYNTSTPPNLITLPTMTQRSGDFSALLPTLIYDPTTTVCNGAVCSKQAFPGNIIPASRLSNVSKSFQSYLTPPDNSNLTNNYLTSLPKALNTHNATIKVDMNLSARNRLYVIYARGKYSTDYTGNLTPTGTALPNPYNSSSGIVIEVPTIAQLHQTYVVSPTLINQVSIGVSRIWIPLYSGTADGKYPQKAGLTGLPPYQASDAFPAINFSGPNAPMNWSTTGPFDEAENNYTIQDNLQWVRGKHTVTFGFQLTWLQDNSARPKTGTSASFTFSNNVTAGFSPTGTLLTNTGHPYASYMLGAVNNATITENAVVWVGARYQNYAGYVQDDWKVSARLNLNLGLRWDLFGPGYEVYNRTSFLNPNTPNPAAGGRLGALEFGGDGEFSCHCRMPVNTHYRNFQPRLGVAYSLDPKTVVRAGFGLSYTLGANGIGGNGGGAGSGQLGFNASASLSSPGTGLPSFYWDSGVPAYQKGPFINPGFGAGFTITNPTGAVSVPYIDRNNAGRAPYYMNWSFGLQRELSPNMAVGAAYSASVGHFLARYGGTGPWSNSMPAQFLALGPLLGAQATAQNIAAAQGIMPGVALPFSNYQGTIAQMLKPFPQYSGVSFYSNNLANSTYHSLMLTFNRRYAHGLTYQLGYTLSKEIDDATGSSQLGGAGGTRNPYDARLDKALGAIDHRHVFHGTIVYNLPFGAGHNLGNSNRVVKGLVSNWMISGIVSLSTGLPLGITGTCNLPGVSGTCIASYNPAFTGPVRINGDYGAGNALNPGAVSYFDRRAFLDPAAYTFGNLPRAAPYGLFAPHLLDESVSVRREINVTERLKFTLAADVFNVTNSVHFAAPGTNLSSANFGQVTTTTNGNAPRKIQLNARVTF